MLVAIRFTKPLEHREGRGWLPGGIGGVIPYDVIDHIGNDITVVLKPPTRLEFEDDVVVLTWDLPGDQTVGLCVHASLIADLTLRKE